MNRVISAVLVVLVVAIFAGAIFFLLPADVFAPDHQEDTPEAVSQVSSSGSGNAVRTFELTASGAVAFVMPPGIGNWRFIEADEGESHYEISLLGADGAVDWLVSIWLPQDVTTGDYRFQDSSTVSDTLTAIVLPLPIHEAPDFNQSATGIISITNLSESNLISGEFSFVAVAADGAEVTVVGSFTDLPLAE